MILHLKFISHFGYFTPIRLLYSIWAMESSLIHFKIVLDRKYTFWCLEESVLSCLSICFDVWITAATLAFFPSFPFPLLLFTYQFLLHFSRSHFNTPSKSYLSKAKHCQHSHTCFSILPEIHWHLNYEPDAFSTILHNQW